MYLEFSNGKFGKFSACVTVGIFYLSKERTTQTSTRQKLTENCKRRAFGEPKSIFVNDFVAFGLGFQLLKVVLEICRKKVDGAKVIKVLFDT